MLFTRSLGAKVQMLVVGTAIMVFAALFLANSYWQRETTLHLIHESSARTAQILLEAISDPMSKGNDEGTEEKFDAIAARYPTVSVHLTDFRGSITYSTRHEAIRKPVKDVVRDARFAALFDAALQKPINDGQLLEMGGTPYYTELKTIPNAPECHHCHGGSQPILGAMVMLQDISADAALLRTRQWQGGALSLGGMLALTAVLSLFMRRAVVGRVRTIAQVSSEIERGNYAVSFTDDSRDELGVLSANLAAMVATIRNQLEYNKSVLGGIIVPLTVMDKAGRIEFANQPMCAILGSPCKELMGLSLREVLEKGGRDCQLQCDPVAQVLSTGASTSGMLRFVRRDGVAFPLHYEASPLRDTDGTVVGVIAVMIDLTQEEEDKAHIEAQRRNLLEVAEEVTGVARALSDAAGELSVRMEELARNVVESTDETAQVATAMDEMNATVMEVTRNASATAEAADLANREAQQGGEEMQSTVAETRQVADRAAGLAASLNDLAARADNIGRVIDVINEIADQTNLLALNAAIEAARAGDAGRGFAVVADEVRKLAEKTMTATKEVERAIQDIQSGTALAVDEMTRTQGQVETTADKAGATGEALGRIVRRAVSIADMVRNIATASEQQSATSDEINRNVTRINDLSRDIADRIHTAEASIREVSSMARRLGQLVERFRQ